MKPHYDHDDLHDRGLQFDLATLMSRRTALKMFGGAALVTLVGCSDDDNGGSDGGVAAGATNTPRPEGGVTQPAAVNVSPIPTSPTPISACTALPQETAGPFPGDGSNGPNVLQLSGVVRRDIRSSIVTSSTVAQGVPLTVNLTVVDTQNQCRPMAGAAVYIWQCDRVGNYSMYSQPAVNENYLRGVQAADANGVVTFTSIFPGAYSGRWPHIHFEVYPSLAQATSSANKRATSQLALPEDVSNAVYATTGYEQSMRNMVQTPLSRDNVFADGVDLQMAQCTGSVSAGYTATLLLGV